MTHDALDVRDLTASHRRPRDPQVASNLSVPFGEVHADHGSQWIRQVDTQPRADGQETSTTAGGSAHPVAGVEIMGMTVDERARAGLFEAFQYPTEVPGVSARRADRRDGMPRTPRTVASTAHRTRRPNASTWTGSVIVP